MKKSWLMVIVGSCLLLTGCAGGSHYSTSGQSPTTTASDAMRVGDKITIRLTGVPQDSGYINEYQIPESGDITLPDLQQSFHAAGVHPGDLAAQITAAYRNDKIYTNPNITVIPEERFVSVGGDVRQPTRVVYTPDLTLLGAINSCGGFTEYANKHQVRIVRGGQIIVVDAAAAARGVPGAIDPPVYPGDQITIPRTMF